MTDDLVERLYARAHQGIAATPFNLLMDAKERIEALTAQLAGDADARALVEDRLEQLVAQVDALTAERDARIDPTQVQALVNAAAPMLAEALAAAEAERDRLRAILSEMGLIDE